jgi:predicted kinase
MKTVYIMMGVPGSGKSTWIRSNISDRYATVSADHFFEDAKENYTFNPGKLHLAHKQCFDRYSEALANPEIDTVVVDNTNTKRQFIQPYILEAQRAGCCVVIVAIIADVAGAAMRNVHGVPLATIERMHSEMQNTLKLGFPASWEIKEVITVNNL